MFIGQYSHSLDAKGRLIMPKSFREKLGKEFKITAGLDGCLFAYPEKDWRNFEEKLLALPLSDKGSRLFTRNFLSNAFDGEMDKQGRALIPQKLRDMAHLSKDVVLAGVGNRIEIWDKEKWEELSTYENMEELASNMEGLGI